MVQPVTTTASHKTPDGPAADDIGGPVHPQVDPGDATIAVSIAAPAQTATRADHDPEPGGAQIGQDAGHRGGGSVPGRQGMPFFPRHSRRFPGRLPVMYSDGSALRQLSWDECLALMLVLGSRGIGAFTALLLGSVSRYAASHASCPVVVVRDEAPSPHGLVGVGVGDLDTCGDALTFAFEEASLRKASLDAVHAWHTPQTEISRTGEAFSPPSPQAGAADAAQYLSGLLDERRAKYPMCRSAKRSCTATRAARWSACPPAPTWWWSAGMRSTPACRGSARSGTPC